MKKRGLFPRFFVTFFEILPRFFVFICLVHHLIERLFRRTALKLIILLVLLFIAHTHKHTNC